MAYEFVEEQASEGEVVLGYDEYLGSTSYYPFGMAYSHSSLQTETGALYWTDKQGGVENRYTYNGKEHIDDLDINLHDYGARFYDPAIGRFTTVDPLADQFPGYSPYNYTLNNPINMIDPDGRAPEWIEDGNGNLIGEVDDDAVSLADHLGVSQDEANEIFNNLENWDGGNNTTGITDVEGHTLSLGNNSNSLSVGSIGFNFSIGRGIGIEDGENSLAFLTVKYLKGLDASIFMEGSSINSISGNRINPSDMAGPGSEISMGAFFYSYTAGGDNYLTGSNSLNPDLYRVNSHAIGVGLDISRTDASTYTWTFKPAKLPQYYKLKMGGL